MALKTLFQSPAVRAHDRVMNERKAATGKVPRTSSESESAAGPSTSNNAAAAAKPPTDFRTARSGLLPWGTWSVAATR